METARPPLSRLVLAIAAVPVVLHLWPNPEYGYFRDELYYLACAARPALGYVDHPPLAPLLLALQQSVTGGSPAALRLLPAAASGALVLFAALFARRLGGGAAAQAMAATAAALAPGYLVVCDFYSMNALAVVLWSSVLYAFAIRVQDDRPRMWYLLGAIFGIALLNKHTVVLLALALGAGMLLTRWRRDFLSRPLWGGVAIAALLFLPNLVWQISHGFPSLEFYANAQANKNAATPPHMVVAQQLLVTGPVAGLLWAIGVAALLMRRAWRPLRPIGWAFPVLLGTLMASGASRPDRMAGVYPVLIAAGAVTIDQWCGARRWLRGTAIALVAAGGLLLLPIGVAALPSSWARGYAGALGSLIRIERGHDLQLPQWLGDRRGWEELAAAMARAHDSLSEEERTSVRVLASNYGQAGACERFGPALGLPPVLSSHNSYFHWSIGDTDAQVYLCVGYQRELLDQLFADVELFEQLDCPLALENGTPIYIARRPRFSLGKVWDQLRIYQ